MFTPSAAVGAGAVGGVFLAFSAFVMPALRRLPAADGIRAMQAINKAAPDSKLFVAALLGAGALAAGAGAAALDELDEPSGIARLVGAALYLASVAVTATYHVPRNDRLALVDPAHPMAAAQWRAYLAGWMPWNHARTWASIASCAAFVFAAHAR